MANKELDMEIRSLESERRMGEVELKSHQSRMADMLNGSMGEEIMNVLSGKQKVKLPFRKRLKYKIDGILKLFTRNDEHGI